MTQYIAPAQEVQKGCWQALQRSDDAQKVRWNPLDRSEEPQKVLGHTQFLGTKLYSIESYNTIKMTIYTH
jgi:hypothetical protein